MLGKYKLVGQLVGSMTALALVVTASWWVISPRIELQARRADIAERQLVETQQMIEAQARVLSGQQDQISRMLGVERQLQQLAQVISHNTRQQSRAIEELKRNDQAIADYLRTAVPADLGLLYARPSTTDPAAYRADSAVPFGAVPSAGQAGAESQ